MTFRLRYVAPAGSPIQWLDLARWGRQTMPGADPAGFLRDAIRRRFGVRHVALTSTGRAGMTLLFRALRRVASPDRDEVILPSYTCYSVAASAVKSGLKIRLVDVTPETLDYDTGLEAAPWDRVLAVVATNLYGYPNDMRRLSELAKARGAFLVDDAAQAMGARSGAVWSGAWGEAGLFSFDKGKNVSAVDGGAVVTNSDALASILRDEMTRVPEVGLLSSAAGAAKALAYFALLRPWLYGVPARIPQLGLGRTVFTDAFPVEQPPRALSALAAAMLPRLDEFARMRSANAAALLDVLATVPGMRRIQLTAGSEPAYLRLPLLVLDTDARDQVLNRLTAAGIGASASYPTSIADIPALQGHFAGSSEAPGGRYVAQHILTLPTHPFVTPADIQQVARTVTTAMDLPGDRSADASALPEHAPGKVR